MSKDYNDDLWDLKADAKKVLKINTILDKDQNIDKRFNLESLNLAKFKEHTLWNTCLRIISNSLLYPIQAKEELVKILKNQDVNGFIKFNYAQKSKQFKGEKNLLKLSLTHPPLIATALRAIYEATSQKDFVIQNIKNVSYYFDYLYETRREKENRIHLLHIKHPLENPINYPLDYEKISKECNIQRNEYRVDSKRAIEENTSQQVSSNKFNKNHTIDLLFNSIYIQGCFDLAYLYSQIGNVPQLTKFTQRAIEIENSLIKNCWNKDENIYFGLHGKDKSFYNIKTCSSLIPIILDNIPNSHIHYLVDNHLLNEQEFYTEYPIPIIPPTVKTMNDTNNLHNLMDLIRLDLNWLIIKGLQKHGFDNIAMELTQKSIELVKKFGFWEYYHTNNGIGVGIRNYTPSTIIVDIEDKIFGSNLDFIFNQEWNRIKKLPDF